ncbi:hypothetical protein O2N63_02030 [Aliiroseovarius sp. KMU-50]|uniref:Uncharacterized protein n=1 Tax=Aliiroseovarius salicola TaxID=3009082 RepID=A0ABT4VX93_9RHOB|nr:hypothetical protein [Aliiroseovarius sp. KMU-50]MDA5092859.1 hypothetical protein [Aliiroseovarius sp. KMU-50]
MAKLFLHIGFAKTGTTSIQNDMVKNFDALLEQGILYPSDPRAPFMHKVQHLPLVAAIPNHTVHNLPPEKKATLDRAYNSLHSHLSKYSFNTLVLSSEFFGSPQLGVKELQWIKDQFKDFEICVIAYIRRQDQHFLSGYQENIKNGRQEPLDMGAYVTSPVLKFGARLEPWREVFGDEKVIVRPFSPKNWPDGELFLDFLEVIGGSADGLALSKPRNEGLDYRVVDIFRRLNAKKPSQGISAFRAWWKPSYFPSTLAKQKMQLSYETVEEMRDYFLPDNERALRSTDISAGDFFPAVNKDQQELIAPSSPDQDLLLHIISKLADEKRNRKPRKIAKKVSQNGLLWKILKRGK